MLSNRIESLKPSETIALATKARELKAAGDDVISLTVGEPDWDTFDTIKSAAKKAIDEGHTKYLPANGLPELRKAIAQKIQQQHKLEYQDSEITVTSGGKFTIFSAIQAVINPGDEVIIPAPYWVSYPSMVELAEGVSVIVSCDRGTQFKMSGAMLEAAITPKTKMVILNSPSNPTGEVYSKDELKSIAAVLEKYPHILILSDDIYNQLVFAENLAPHLLDIAAGLKSRTLIVNGVAKTFSMTGWRVGWALGPEAWIKGMNKYQSQTVTCACSIAQVATAFAISNCDREVSEVKALLIKRKQIFMTELTKLKGVVVDEPRGAFYFWPDISSFIGKTYGGKAIQNSTDFANALLEDQKVVVVPGDAFGLDGYIRLSFALDEKRLVEAASRMEKFISKIH